MPFFDAQVMLCLAGLAYRGVHRATAGRLHDDGIAGAIDAGLQTLAPLAGGWDLAWGPATYRAPVRLVDDALVYVAHDRRRPRRYVVAVRGTNPRSWFDWVFGDCWAGHQTPWRRGGAGERISLSTALGLTLALGLRSNGPRRDVLSHAGDGVDARLDGVQTAAAATADLLGALARPALAPLRRAFADVVQDQLRREADDDGIEAQLRTVAARWQSRTSTRMSELVAEAQPLTGGRLDLAVLSLLETDVALRRQLGTGADLVQFLGGAVARGADEVAVTGHSKGGALASTLALWLAESQGDAGGWDPHRRARVHCWSFAGPTAGNAAFAARSDAVLGVRSHRIANALDVVPCAWEAHGLARVARLYDHTAVAALPAAEMLVGLIAAATGHLDYRHAGTDVTVFPGTLHPTEPLFVGQMVHQHMQAYCDHLGLSAHGVGVRSFFDPPAPSIAAGHAGMPA